MRARNVGSSPTLSTAYKVTKLKGSRAMCNTNTIQTTPCRWCGHHSLLRVWSNDIVNAETERGVSYTGDTPGLTNGGAASFEVCLQCQRVQRDILPYRKPTGRKRRTVTQKLDDLVLKLERVADGVRGWFDGDNGEVDLARIVKHLQEADREVVSLVRTLEGAAVSREASAKNRQKLVTALRSAIEDAVVAGMDPDEVNSVLRNGAIGQDGA